MELQMMAYRILIMYLLIAVHINQKFLPMMQKFWYYTPNTYFDTTIKFFRKRKGARTG